ncbi:MAG: hypothetical protein ACRCWU_01565 [Metamycoplasmataceae bacterium]
MHWGTIENSYFFFNIYHFRLIDPTRNEGDIVYKSTTSCEYKPSNEYFTIETID